MGKGDIKTKKGKIFAGSYGNSRKRKNHAEVIEKRKIAKKEQKEKLAKMK